VGIECKYATWIKEECGYHFEPREIISTAAAVYLLEVEPKPVLSCLVFEKLEPDPEDDLELPSPLLFHPPLLLPHPLFVWLPLLAMRPAAYPAAAPPNAPDHIPGLQP
jgi:hypothetical protein